MYVLYFCIYCSFDFAEIFANAKNRQCHLQYTDIISLILEGWKIPPYEFRDIGAEPKYELTACLEPSTCTR